MKIKHKILETITSLERAVIDLPLRLYTVVRGLREGCCLHLGAAQPALLCSGALFWKKRAGHAMGNYVFVKSF